MAKSTFTTPAFWDLHLHGAAGVDFMSAGPDEIVFACERLGRNGTGAFAPTLLTAESALLREACRRWGAFLERLARNPRFLPRGCARPLGLHLEGPFLNPQMAGAHPRKLLKNPSPAAAVELVRLAQGHVAIVTLAPELPGAVATTRKLASKGIRVQLGHTHATAEEAERAVRAGASGVTHLYNAMRVHHRSPGVLPMLTQGRVTAELITDGVHLDADFVLWTRDAARGSVYAVSDGCSAIGAPARAKLTLGSLVLKREGRTAVVAENGILAGGATYLTQHPGFFHRKLSGSTGERREFLELFYAIQRGLFPRLARSIDLRNHFDSKTLRYLGSSS